MPMKAALAAAALLLAAACSDAGGPDGAIRVRTDASGYQLPGSGSPVVVGFTVRNTGSEPISVGDCGTSVAAIPDRREAGAWVQQGSCVNLPVYFPPRVLAPGEVAEGEVSVFAAGRYRIRVPMAQGELSADAVSPDFIVSP
jgi:hypothetical protein